MSEQKDVSTKAEVLEILSRYLPPDLRAQVMVILDREEQLEQLVRACLLYIKELSDYNWRSAPRTIALQDWAATMGIVAEVKP